MDQVVHAIEQVELRQRRFRFVDGVPAVEEHFRQFAEDAALFLTLLLQQRRDAVIEDDEGVRLHVDGVARRRFVGDDAGEAVDESLLHQYGEAAAAHRKHALLEHAAGRAVQEAVAHGARFAPFLFQFGADLAQFWRGAVGQRAVAVQNRKLFELIRKLADAVIKPDQRRKPLFRRLRAFPDGHGQRQQDAHLQQFLPQQQPRMARFVQRCGDDLHRVVPREIAAAFRKAQISRQQILAAYQAWHVGGRFQLHESPFSQFASRARGKALEDVVDFERLPRLFVDFQLGSPTIRFVWGKKRRESF